MDFNETFNSCRSASGSYVWGGSLFQNFQDAAEAFASWFFADYHNESVGQLRCDLEECRGATLAQNACSAYEDALLALRDDELLAIARYWSADEADEADRIRIREV